VNEVESAWLTIWLVRSGTMEKAFLWHMKIKAYINELTGHLKVFKIISAIFHMREVVAARGEVQIDSSIDVSVYPPLRVGYKRPLRSPLVLGGASVFSRWFSPLFYFAARHL
jgi:hypothetical protein